MNPHNRYIHNNDHNKYTVYNEIHKHEQISFPSSTSPSEEKSSVPLASMWGLGWPVPVYHET